ncbi:hypothetical protein TWF730_007531 [Orbilia blumenaviensis]|uniref:Clr5 domain-containing protein n=1 Tax=Orbilia blumenaviensis TaxID=1796055 RepID=A0AAV9V8S6_9PEZI
MLRTKIASKQQILALSDGLEFSLLKMEHATSFKNYDGPNSSKRQWVPTSSWDHIKTYVTHEVSKGKPQRSIVAELGRQGISIELHQLKRLLKEWGIRDRNISKKQRKYIFEMERSLKKQGQYARRWRFKDSNQPVKETQLKVIMKSNEKEFEGIKSSPGPLVYSPEYLIEEIAVATGPNELEEITCAASKDFQKEFSLGVQPRSDQFRMAAEITAVVPESLAATTYSTTPGDVNFEPEVIAQGLDQFITIDKETYKQDKSEPNYETEPNPSYDREQRPSMLPSSEAIPLGDCNYISTVNFSTNSEWKFLNNCPYTIDERIGDQVSLEYSVVNGKLRTWYLSKQLSCYPNCITPNSIRNLLKKSRLLKYGCEIALTRSEHIGDWGVGVSSCLDIKRRKPNGLTSTDIDVVQSGPPQTLRDVENQMGPSFKEAIIQELFELNVSVDASGSSTEFSTFWFRNTGVNFVDFPYQLRRYGAASWPVFLALNYLHECCIIHYGTSFWAKPVLRQNAQFLAIALSSFGLSLNLLRLWIEIITGLFCFGDFIIAFDATKTIFAKSRKLLGDCHIFTIWVAAVMQSILRRLSRETEATKIGVYITHFLGKLGTLKLYESYESVTGDTIAMGFILGCEIVDLQMEHKRYAESVKYAQLMDAIISSEVYSCSLSVPWQCTTFTCFSAQALSEVGEYEEALLGLQRSLGLPRRDFIDTEYSMHILMMVTSQIMTKRGMVLYSQPVLTQMAWELENQGFSEDPLYQTILVEEVAADFRLYIQEHDWVAAPPIPCPEVLDTSTIV